MSELWREWLYPLGFISTVAFGLRMLIQWLASEVKGQSSVMPAFWILSLVGNISLAIHGLIQVQFHVCIVQVFNAVISWRNLNLMRPPEEQYSLRSTLGILAASSFAAVAAFWIQGFFLNDGSSAWFRIPSTPWQEVGDSNIPFGWHLFGFFGLALFSSRFWIQWWGAEQHKKSYLGSGFWWASLIGDVVCTSYFIAISDPVNYLGPLFGLIVYARNLMLIHKTKDAGEDMP